MTSRSRLLLVALLALAGLGCEQLLTRPIRYGRVVVEAQTRAGQPLEGISTILYTSSRPMGYGSTDANGRVVFPEVPPGNYGVFMQLPDSVRDLSELEGGSPRNFVDGLDIKTGMDTTLRFIFARRGNGAMEARVRDQFGAALANIQVYFYTTSAVVGSAQTGVDGIARYQPFPLGQAGAFVVPSDTLGVAGSPTQFRDGFLVDGETVPRAEFTLTTCKGSIAVSVRDSADAPVSAMNVDLYDSRSVRRTTATNAEGQVTFAQVGCGNYGVSLGAARSGYENVPGRGNSFVDGLEVVAGGSLSATLRMRRLP